MTETPEAAPAESAGEYVPVPGSRLHAEIGAAIDGWFIDRGGRDRRPAR